MFWTRGVMEHCSSRGERAGRRNEVSKRGGATRERASRGAGLGCGASPAQPGGPQATLSVSYIARR
jgi:hypothetical protein